MFDAPGNSGVITSDEVESRENGKPQVRLTRFLTHFQWDEPPVLIQQSPFKGSMGILMGATKGDLRSLLPGWASFSQYLILTLNARPLANRDPLVMTAERVTEWPPIGATFVSESPTKFYDFGRLEDPDAEVVATLMACRAIATAQLQIPER